MIQPEYRHDSARSKIDNATMSVRINLIISVQWISVTDELSDEQTELL